MKQTVIGMFDDTSDAQDAVQQLVENGFPRARVDISLQKPNQSDESVSDFFSSLFGKEESSSYTEAARQCEALVTVHAESENEALRAAEILDDSGALDMDEQISQYGHVTPEKPVVEREHPVTEQETLAAEFGSEETTIPVIEERLSVGKKEVETGRTKLRSKIIERPVEEKLRLREEHVHIERNPVNRPATEADLAGFRESEVELTEHAEVPVVAKEARVVEEVRFGKDVREHEETVKDTVRKTEVDVEETSER